MKVWHIWLVAAALGLAACDTALGGGEKDAGGPAADAGMDGGESDAGVPDAGPGDSDAGADGGFNMTEDAGVDGGDDAGFDAGTPSFTVADATAIEGDGVGNALVFEVRLGVPWATPVTVNFTTSDGTATADDYQPTAGTVTFPAGTTTQTISIPLIGDTLDENNETVTVTLSDASDNLPITRAIATGAIVDDDPSPSLSVANLTLDEGGGTMTFSVVLSAVSGRPVTYNFATEDQTALAGLDYTATAGASTISAGETTVSISVPILPDALNEGDETFKLNLTNIANTTAGSLSAVGQIQDDDPLPSISAEDLTEAEGNSGTHDAVFTLTLSPVSGRTVSVNFATDAGTATPPSDFTHVSGTVTFAPGETVRTIAVPIVGDTSNEPIEQFQLVLSNPVNATLPPTGPTCTITNDDGPPTLNAFNVTGAEGSDAGTKVFGVKVSLAPVAGVPVTVDYATLDGTAAAPLDYAVTSGTLTFAPGETQKFVNVPVNQDKSYETDESFTVTLSNTAAQLGQATATVTIQNDDPLPTVSILPTSKAELTGSLGTPFTFTVQLSPASGTAATVTWSTLAGTALAGIDFVAASGTITFAPGETSKTATVSVVPDSLWEANETFVVKLGTSTGATILAAASQAVGTIIDDDVAPSLSVVDDTAWEKNPGQPGNVAFQVQMSKAVGRDVAVSYTTQDGTAKAVTDYVAKTGVLVFVIDPLTGKTKDPNLMLAAPIATVKDLVHESTETFNLVIYLPTAGVTLARPVGIGTIWDEDP